MHIAIWHKDSKMGNRLKLSSFHLKNFKAVQDSKAIRFTPLTAFIGNNGSGKSSIVEALETLQTLVMRDIDKAMAPWHGFEHIWNKAVEHRSVKDKITHPMTFASRGISKEEDFRFALEVVADPNFDRVYFQGYKAAYGKADFIERPGFISEGTISDPKLKSFVKDWQFLRLNPYEMTEPLPQKRSSGKITLHKDGSNIAEYLQSVRDADIRAFDGIIETLKVVLPFAVDLQPAITSELERNVYLNLSEEHIEGKLAGWLLSTGTLRILAILALLRHPIPAPVIIIEEIENGLDPRTIHLLVDEIRHFVESGRGQVIFTTHSPYLLDLLPLSYLVVCDRDESGGPRFTRPGSQKALENWARQFTPGKLYTMGTLTRS